MSARAASVLACALAALAPALSAAAPPAAKPPPAPAGPPPKIPGLPSVARVRVEVGKDRLVVVHDVNLPRGEWTSGDLGLFVSFGGPGFPSAIDAHLHAVPDGELSAADDAAGEAVALERAPRRPPNAALLLGRPQMAGVVAKIRDAGFRKATQPSGMAVLRVRTVAALPERDASGAREVLARLGVSGGAPLTLLRIEVAAADESVGIARAEARLCGPEADPYPLSVAVLPRDPSVRASAPPGLVAPMFATRHASDDLCVRFVTR